MRPVVLFDVDQTLYPTSSGVLTRVDQRINRFLEERIGVPGDRADSLRRQWWLSHGTTLRGLEVEHRVDADEYLEFVHDVPLEDLLRPDAALRAILLSLDVRRVVFSNGSRRHAQRVVEHLGIADCFERSFALEDLDYVPKPKLEAFERVTSAIGVAPADCALVEDSLSNLQAAKTLGMTTVWVASEGEAPAHVDHSIATVHQIAELG